MSPWLVIGLAGVGTFAIRLSFIALFGILEVPVWLERALRYVAPAVLAALVVPAVAAPGGIDPSFNPRVVAALVSLLVAWRTRSVGATIIVGLPALWLVRWLWP